MNIKEELRKLVTTQTNLRFNDLEINPEKIQAIMINEVVPEDPNQDFYGDDDADYLKTTIPLFQKAGLPISSISDILEMGVYITNAVKSPKYEYTIEKSSIENSLPFLEKEINLFSNVKVILLMGDVAKKSFNMITKKSLKKNIVPSISTYKLRGTEIYYGSIRVMPSYIMTGGNILIEKSKFEMASHDIAAMAVLIK
ncbi:uracil-DNA glycosylase [Anaerocolumna sedimenticola]|uniref:Uracil-DNA glycosylase n=1 Tax=Anaerocolumna sedimenticola TaxID=2696063 RepID=A0A6P1TQR2_9FIRM|nr:uracil-DNA glycosylase family protein [Anaerocolumna sedimenticola]QHQ61885.1 uracil-DNA glycosylase [Anaerocolumna sedimenticola]